MTNRSCSDFVFLVSHLHVCVCVRVCDCVCVCACACACMWEIERERTFVFVCLCRCSVCVYLCVCVRVCVCIKLMCLWKWGCCLWKCDLFTTCGRSHVSRSLFDIPPHSPHWPSSPIPSIMLWQKQGCL